MEQSPNSSAGSRVNQDVVLENFEFTTLSVAKNYRLALIASFTPYLKGKVIEIGSGIGQMSSLLGKLKDIQLLQCVEPNEIFCRELKKTLPAQSAIVGTIFDVPKTGWDGIVSINVLEHIKDDEGELRAYWEMLKGRQGNFCLFVPARPEIYSLLDKDVGHYRRYTKKELKNKLENAGFEIEHLYYYNFVGYFAWWFSFCFLKQRSFNIHAVRFFDTVVFPVVHFFESHVCRPPIGQNLLVVARAKYNSFI